MLVLEQNKTFIKDTQVTVNSLQKVEQIINNDESNIKGKILNLNKKLQEIKSTLNDAKEYKEKVRTEINKFQNINITEENVTEYVKPKTELYRLWLEQEVKRMSRDNCMWMIKKLYESKKISLPTFLYQIDLLASKEFVNIYKKNKLERLIKKEEGVNV
jgi:hypothetical protein